MKRQFAASLIFTAVAGCAYAASDVYLCVDKQGRKEYRNTGITKGCKKVALPGLTTVPMPAHRPAQAAAPKKASSPANFPKVDGATQKSRDSDRKQILLDEQRAEEQKLANLKKEYNNGEPERQGNEKNYAKYQERVGKMKEDIERSEKNIEALKREIGNLK
ncbi:MAG: hypothetical protein H6R01_1673 [Burkholderiaceae bacterium]|nr:hypothetical protein [Burkholderiaceae bacterium]